ncbi:MAG: Ig-like domain-containing protein, partial [Pseudomonadota bacterium]|nr:Ig-like domain-containing protein [Pseudomonadota bacterium]
MCSMGLRAFWLIFFAVFVIASAGCNSSGGETNEVFEDIFGPDEEPPAAEDMVASVQLLASSPQLQSGGADSVTLTAVVKDDNNVLLEGVEVGFAADNGGNVQVVRSVTDATGTAEALLSTAGNRDNRTITVTATAGSASDVLTVD